MEGLKIHLRLLKDEFRIPYSTIQKSCRSSKEFDKLKCSRESQLEEFYQCLDVVKLKQITLVRYKKDPRDDLKPLMREIQMIKNLKHPHILKFFTPATYRLSSPHLVFEPFDCFLGDVIHYDVDKLYHPSVKKNVMWQLLSGLDYLHEHAVMHRNIQPNNLALDSKGCLKICNFRNARYLWDNDVTLEVDDFHYQSAEQLLNMSLCSSAVDIWSAACIFMELILERRFFKAKSQSNVLGEIFALFGFPSKTSWPQFFEHEESTYLHVDEHNIHHYNCLSLLLKREGKPQDEVTMHLLESMFNLDPMFRSKASSCINHAFFKREPLASDFQQDLGHCINIALTRRDAEKYMKK